LLARRPRRGPTRAPRLAPEALEPRCLLAAQLVADVNPVTESANPADFVNFNGALYFTAAAPATRQALWKTDGTAAGTVPVLPEGMTPPGYRTDYPFDVRELTPSGGRLFFTTYNFGPAGIRLWSTDGTPQGTVLLSEGTSANPNLAGIFNLTDVNGTLFFTVRYRDFDPELWKTNGTPAGTTMVRRFDVSMGHQVYGPSSLTNVGGTLLFAAEEGSSGQKLWKSDGTPAGTVPDNDTGPGAGGFSPSGLTVVGDKVLFTAFDLEAGFELWTTDGTAGGTSRLTDLYPGVDSGLTQAARFYSVGGLAYFGALTPDAGNELWRTDGTAAGTVRVTDTDDAHGVIEGVYAAGGAAVFRVVEWVTGAATLYRTLGTPQSTTPLATIALPGQNQYMAFGTGGDVEYFVAGDVAGGTPRGALWRTDGTAAGTVQLTTGGTPATAPAVFNGKAYFASSDPLHGVELWSSDGTPAGTTLLKDLRANSFGSGPVALARLGDAVLFGADDGVHGLELWTSDGTAAGTSLVSDIDAGPESALSTVVSARPLPLDGRLLFVANDGVHGFELWTTDGTAAGTFMLKDIAEGPTSSAPAAFYAFGGAAYFAASPAAGVRELWRTDGTPGGTAPFKDVAPTSSSPGNPSAFVTAGGAMYFAAPSDASSSALWRSDGTAEGTRPVGANVHVYDSLVALDDRAYFINNGISLSVMVTNAAGDGVEPWAPAAGLGPRKLAAMDGHLYFTATDRNGNNPGLYRDNGPGAPALRLGNVNAVRSSSDLAVAGHHVFVVGDPPAPGQGVPLWATDGTPEGTAVVQTFLGTPGDLGGGFQAIGDTLYFTATDARGPGLWRSDGTPATTYQVQPAGTTPVAALGDAVLFAAYDFAHGTELWRAGAGPSLAAEAGVAYAAEEGQTVRLSAAGSTAPPGAAIVSYEWDFDYDGATFNVDATGATADVPGASIDGPGLRSVAVRVRDSAGDTATDTAVLRMTNVKPTVTVVAPPTAGLGRPYAISLSAQDPGPDTLRWRVDWGDGVTTNVTGPAAAPSHTYQYKGATPYTIRVTPSDEDGTYAVVTATVTITASVAGRYAYSNNSIYDNNRPAPEAADDAAIVAGKVALRPGGRSGAANVTNSVRGLNGIIIDLVDRPAGAANPVAADFVFRTGTGSNTAAWRSVPGASILVRQGAGANGSDRVTIALPDGTARNAWLQVAVLPNERTGLVVSDIFYFGNLAGDTGDDRATPAVDARDVAATRANFGRTTAAALAASDFNRDGRVNAADVAIVRGNLHRSLPPFTAPAAPAGTAAAAPFGSAPITASRAARPARRGVLDVIASPLA
jgi:ELWxxDGT repeat protein